MNKEQIIERELERLAEWVEELVSHEAPRYRATVLEDWDNWQEKFSQEEKSGIDMGLVLGIKLGYRLQMLPQHVRFHLIDKLNRILRRSVEYDTETEICNKMLKAFDIESVSSQCHSVDDVINMIKEKRGDLDD